MQDIDRGHVEPGGPTLTRLADAGGREVAVRKLSVGMMDNNCYVLVDPPTSQALLVDAADEPERILAEVGDLEVVAIVTTHGHPDHWQALDGVAEETGAPVHLHPADAEMVPRRADVAVEDGARLRFGQAEATLLHTPGHTPGSVCVLLAGERPWLLTGDTLFPGGPGKTTAPDQFAQIMDSLERRVFDRLPDATQVCPGHGDDTTLGAERPHLDEWRARGW